MNKNITNKEIVHCTNKFLGTTFKDYHELKTRILEVRERLHRQWLNGWDLTVYDDPEYIYEAIHCYEKTVKCTSGTVDFFTNRKPRYNTKDWGGYNGPPISDLTLIDVWNGCGLTSVQFARCGFQTETFNTCVPQIEFQDLLCRELDVPKITNHVVLPQKTYDVVASFEVLEHYNEPLPHLKELLELCHGFLTESTGFNGSKDNIGHYDQYIVGGVPVSPTSAKNATTALQKAHLEMVFDGFSRQPRVWMDYRRARKQVSKALTQSATKLYIRFDKTPRIWEPK